MDELSGAAGSRRALGLYVKLSALFTGALPNLPCLASLTVFVAGCWHYCTSEAPQGPLGSVPTIKPAPQCTVRWEMKMCRIEGGRKRLATNTDNYKSWGTPEPTYRDRSQGCWVLKGCPDGAPMSNGKARGTHEWPSTCSAPTLWTRLLQMWQLRSHDLPFFVPHF
jgi:hypothetical protein